MQHKSKDYAVMIVGGGLTGLCAALFLRRHGITPILVERHRSVSIHPRARGFDMRTMEVMRELGLADAVREAGKALAGAWGMLTAPSLAAALEGKQRNTEAAANAGPAAFAAAQFVFDQGPEMPARCTQDISEPILYEAAQQSGAAIFFHTALLHFTQDDDGVTAYIRNRDTGEERSVRVSYLIAADGARSPVREALQAETLGRGAIANLLNIYFEADLGEFVKGREFSMVRVITPELKGLLCSINNTTRWVFHMYCDPSKSFAPTDFNAHNVGPLLKQAIGLPDVQPQVISILPWQPTVKVVKQMQHGHIFFAGDAAHVMTPYGGKGASCGIQDVHNLCWKLAMVLHGQAAPSLLHTYQEERQPVGLHYAVSSGAMANEFGLVKKLKPVMVMAFLKAMVGKALRLNRLFPGMNTGLGSLFGLPVFRYGSSATGLPFRGWQTTNTFHADAGTRMPHSWVTHHGQRISTLDVLGNGFVLFTDVNNAAWRKAAAALRLKVVSMGRGGELEGERSLGQLAGISANGAVLVRPDGFVMHKWDTLPAAPVKALKELLGQAGIHLELETIVSEN